MWALSAPRWSREREPSRSTMRRVKSGLSAARISSGARPRPSRQSTTNNVIRAAPGTITLTKALAIVWAKKYSTVSTSWVAHRDEVAGAASEQVGRRELVELAEQIRSAYRPSQPEGHVVGDPVLEEAEESGQDGNDDQ